MIWVSSRSRCSASTTRKSSFPHEDELRDLAVDHEGSWLAYLATDTLANYEKNNGVDPKHRPRGYNEGPKE